jgi:WD40 repeat protein
MLAATTAAPDTALYLWDLQTRSQVCRTGHTDHVMGLAGRPDGQALATASSDETVRLWSLDPNQPPRTLRLHAGPQGQLAFTPEGRHLITANGDGSIFVLRLAAPPEAGSRPGGN